MLHNNTELHWLLITQPFCLLYSVDVGIPTTTSPTLNVLLVGQCFVLELAVIQLHILGQPSAFQSKPILTAASRPFLCTMAQRGWTDVKLFLHWFPQLAK